MQKNNGISKNRLLIKIVYYKTLLNVLYNIAMKLAYHSVKSIYLFILRMISIRR